MQEEGRRNCRKWVEECLWETWCPLANHAQRHQDAHRWGQDDRYCGGLAVLPRQDPDPIRAEWTRSHSTSDEAGSHCLGYREVRALLSHHDFARFTGEVCYLERYIKDLGHFCGFDRVAQLLYIGNSSCCRCNSWRTTLGRYIVSGLLSQEDVTGQ